MSYPSINPVFKQKEGLDAFFEEKNNEIIASRLAKSESLQSLAISASEIAATDIKPDDTPSVISLKKARALALEELSHRIQDLPADKLSTAIEQMTKTINLISGKPTENVAVRSGLFIVTPEQSKNIRDIFA